MGKTAKDYEDQYDKPELRAQLKDDIMDGDKGGKPGQWSARKSQLLTTEYEKQGGGYKGAKTEEQKSLESWTNEEWQTKEGNAEAVGEGEDGGTKRYLPKKAWDLLSASDKKKTDQKKQDEGEAAAKQFVENTAKAKAARKYVTNGDAADLTVDMLERLGKKELDDLAKKQDVTGRSKMDKHELAQAIRESFHGADADSGDDDPDEMTKAELYEKAKAKDVSGRSSMSKEELAEAVG